MTEERDPSAPGTSALLTFLIADVRGYTRFTAEHGDEAAARLAGGFAAIAKEIATARGGEVIELRGDEALAVFDSSRQALRAALDLQERFAQETDADPSLPLRVGIGLDAGEAISVEGGYRGGALNLAARLCSIAGAGEIFCSETVIGLARKTDGVAVVHRGEVTLKGLATPVRVIQIAREGELPDSLPPLQPILVTHPNNLPDEPTPFIGREREIDQIVGLFRDPHIRMVTLTGPGGTGKTRLALQVGDTLLYDYRDGVFFVNLAPLADPVLVPSAIAQVLGAKEQAGKDHLLTLSEHLNNKHLLLVLDNVEHLLAASPIVVSLLDACRELHILVTSRSPLHLSREHDYAVPPLSVPDPKHLPELASLSQYESVALFINSASAIRSDFQVTNDNAPAVAEICHRLDGLPLAIELAAARSKLFSPQALLQRLDRTLKLLTGGAKDRPTRQQTLRGAIDWSYGLLSEEEQTLFAQLSVFAGGFTLESAEAVCDSGLDSSIDVFDGVASLVDKSLLRQKEMEDGEPRFFLLETIREYAAERLEKSGEVEAVHQRHADYFLAWAEAHWRELQGAEQVAWVKRFRAEQDNFRGARAWFHAHDVNEELVRLMIALQICWWVLGLMEERNQWMEDACDRSEGLSPGLRERTVNWMGDRAAKDGDFSLAEQWYAESLALAREMKDGERTAWNLVSIGFVSLSRGDYERTRRLYEEALDIFRVRADTLNVALMSINIIDVAERQGDYEGARMAGEESLPLFRELNDVRGIAICLGNLGNVACQEGDYERARTLDCEALRLVREAGGPSVMLEPLETIAAVEAAEHKPERAARLFGASERLRGEMREWIRDDYYRAKLERHCSQARAQLDDEAWETLWAEGRAMTLEQAAAYALGEIER